MCRVGEGTGSQGAELDHRLNPVSENTSSGLFKTRVSPAGFSHSHKKFRHTQTHIGVLPVTYVSIPLDLEKFIRHPLILPVMLDKK